MKVQIGEVGRHGHPQQTARRLLPVLGQGTRRRSFFRHPLRVLQQAGTQLGQYQLARGARQQPLAQPGFELGQAARHG
jgi:hypothetical protein